MMTAHLFGRWQTSADPTWLREWQSTRDKTFNAFWACLEDGSEGLCRSMQSRASCDVCAACLKPSQEHGMVTLISTLSTGEFMPHLKWNHQLATVFWLPVLFS